MRFTTSIVSVISLALLLSSGLKATAEPACDQPILVQKSSKMSVAQYLRYLKKQASKNWYPPRDSGACSVKFFVDERGTVSNVRVTKSSGVQIADKAATNAVHNMHLQPPPWTQPLDVEVRFDYALFDRSASEAAVLSEPERAEPPKN